MTEYFQIELTRGQVARVSSEDWEKLSEHKWTASFSPDTGSYYAVGSSKPVAGVRMHRLIMNAPKGSQVDHKFGDTLDNRRENLRFATKSQNAMNSRTPRTNTSGCRGVNWNIVHQYWVARITVNKNTTYLTRTTVLAEAIKARKMAESEYFGEFTKVAQRLEAT